MRSEQLLEYLKTNCRGRERAVPSAMLEREFHVSGSELRRRINRLRLREHPIASHRSGYFYARTAGDLLGTIRKLEGLVKALEKVIRALEKCMERFGEVEDASGVNG